MQSITILETRCYGLILSYVRRFEPPLSDQKSPQHDSVADVVRGARVMVSLPHYLYLFRRVRGYKGISRVLFYPIQ